MKQRGRVTKGKPVPRWRGAKRRPTDADREEARAKWLHHALKCIHKALKKARDFEVRKISRRIAQATVGPKQQAGGAPAGPSPGAAGALPRLEQQLAAARAADLAALAQQAAAGAGLLPAPQQAAEPQRQAAEAAAAPLPARLVAAQCVQQQLEECKRQLAKKFGGGGAAAAGAGEATAAAAQHRSSDADSDASLPGASDPEAQLALLSEGGSGEGGGGSGEEEGSPPLDDVALGALAKLAAARQGGAARRPRSPSPGGGGGSPASSSGAGGSSGSSSGALALDPAEMEAAWQEALAVSGQAGEAWAQGGGSSGSDADPGSSSDVSSSPVPPPLQWAQLPPPPPMLPDKAAATAPGGKRARPTAGVGGALQQQAPQAKQPRKQRASVRSDPTAATTLKSGKRLGQRARRALFERVYGREARHLQQQEPAAPPPSRQQAGAARSRGGSKPCADAAADLHPSWAARQRQQAALRAAKPQAKKVVFGEDGAQVAVTEPAATVPAEKPRGAPAGPQAAGRQPAPAREHAGGGGGASMHPSWQAKQAQQAKMRSLRPAGSRVVFDED